MLVITDDSTPAEITEAISHLRAKQRLVQVQQVHDELEDDINALLDRLPRWMQLTVRFLGVEVLHVELCESAEGEPDRGDLGSTVIDAGKTDTYLGFTNGREDDAEDRR